MRFIFNFSLLLAVLAFVYLAVTLLLIKLRGVDLPLARGLGVLIFGWGLGQFGVIALGFVPYLTGYGVSLSRRLRYFERDGDPIGALVGLVVHAGLGILLIAGCTYFGLKLIRRSSLAKA
jgi:hypothetical protein